MKLLIFGDVVGKLGRRGVKIMLPIWREKFSPDVVIANAENIMHGKGIGRAQIDELLEAGIDIFTGGNHSLEGKDVAQILNDEMLPITRPANIPGAPGRGVVLYDIAAPVKLLVVNLIGQVFTRPEYISPFDAIDKILEEYSGTTPYIILDWHAEATSEKVVMGYYLDGKVSLVYGTHTHIPSADAKILPKGTAYITDIGMTGGYNSVIGVDPNQAIERFLTKSKKSIPPVETGPIEANALYLEIESSRAAFAKASAAKAVDIKHLREIIPEDKI